MLSLDLLKEAMSQIIHGARVVYIKEGGERIGGGLSTATEDSLWKMPQPPRQDGDVIRVEHASRHAVCRGLCVLCGRNTHTHTQLRHAASPSGRPQLYQRDVAS